MTEFPTPRVLLFDLGGVLIDFVGPQEIARLLDIPLDEALGRWGQSRAVADFETGALDRASFRDAFLAEWRLPVQAEEVLDLYRSWVRGPLPGAHALLDRLRGTYTLACLSNTNEMHWHDMLHAHGLNAAFDAHYASHLLGRAKPDTAVYLAVADDLGVAPDAIFFLDDSQKNVEGAIAAGLQACRAEGPSAAEAALAARGLLPTD
jgi:putative hydrolase of the HAD superfamily